MFLCSFSLVFNRSHYLKDHPVDLTRSYRLLGCQSEYHPRAIGKTSIEKCDLGSKLSFLGLHYIVLQYILIASFASPGTLRVESLFTPPLRRLKHVWLPCAFFCSAPTVWSGMIPVNATANHSCTILSQTQKQVWIQLLEEVWMSYFWKLRCQKSARRCGAKRISKSKVLKTGGLGPLLEVAMSKKCTPLWREAHFEVKMYKTLNVRATFGGSDVEKVHAVVARSTFGSQNVKNTRDSDHFWRFRCRFASLHYTTLHYTTLHYTTLHYTTLHYTTLQLQLHNYTPLH